MVITREANRHTGKGISNPIILFQLPHKSSKLLRSVMQTYLFSPNGFIQSLMWQPLTDRTPTKAAGTVYSPITQASQGKSYRSVVWCASLCKSQHYGDIESLAINLSLSFVLSGLFPLFARLAPFSTCIQKHFLTIFFFFRNRTKGERFYDSYPCRRLYFDWVRRNEIT